MTIHTYLADMGYCDISGHKLDSFVFFNSRLAIKFTNLSNDAEGFVIRLENIVAYNSDMDKKDFLVIRIDSEGSSYGLDIALRLKNERIKNYMVLYLFEKIHDIPVFRALAEKVSISYFDRLNKFGWPYSD